jgi:membrane protein DedA with SNARE-associated domain
VQHFITQYSYLAVFLLMLAESACIPVPSEVIMLLGGALAAGAVPGAHPSLAGIIAAGVLGNVAGSYVAWAVGRYAGLSAARRWGRRVGIREREIDRATAWFERHGSAAVLVGRLVPVVRTFISLPAGFAAMPAGRFGLYTVIGCIPWTAALGIAGYALGANWQSVANGFHGPTYAIAGIIAVALVVAVIMHFRRGRRTGVGGPESDGHDDAPSVTGSGSDRGPVRRHNASVRKIQDLLSRTNGADSRRGQSTLIGRQAQAVCHDPDTQRVHVSMVRKPRPR